MLYYIIAALLLITVSNGNTVNICALGLTKAFDKVNRHALFIKLMKRHIQVKLLTIM